MKPRVIYESDLPEIVELLYEDVELVENRDRFGLALGLTGSHLADVRRVVQLEMHSTRGFFSMCLELWITECSSVYEPTFNNLVAILQKLGHNFVADKILKFAEPHKIEDNQLQPSISSICFDVPREFGVKSTSFIGREAEMMLLTEQLTNSYLLRLNGTDGVGKSSLVTHYCWESYQTVYSNIIWIRAEPEQILNSFSRLTSKHFGEDSILKIYKALQKSSTLIVFDNIESYEAIKEYLPPESSRIHVILISTSPLTVPMENCAQIPINGFTPKDCVQFFRKVLCLSLESAEEIGLAQEIATILGNHPVAIKIAAFYIKLLEDENGNAQKKSVALSLKTMFESMTITAQSLNTKFPEVNARAISSLKSYLELCNKMKHDKNSSYTSASVLISYKITLDYLKTRNYLAVTILELISYFGPDQFPIPILYNIKAAAKFGLSRITPSSSVNEADVKNALNLLENLGLLKIKTANFRRSVNMARILQKIIRDSEDVKVKSISILIEGMRLIQISIEKLDACSGSVNEYRGMCAQHAMYLFRHVQEIGGLDYGTYMSFLNFVSKEGGDTFKRLVGNAG